MSSYFSDILDIELSKSGIQRRTFVNKTIGEGDAYGDRFGVHVLRDGVDVDLSGVAVIGYFIRPNGTTVVIQGEKNGATCWVDLPQSCYVYEGQFKLSIKIVKDGNAVTARIIDGTIVETTIGAIIDPGTVVPDLSEFEELVTRAEEVAETFSNLEIENTLITGTRYRIVVSTG